MLTTAYRLYQVKPGMNIHAFTKEKRLVYGKIGAAEENASAALFFA